jgi:hypothetical protein
MAAYVLKVCHRANPARMAGWIASVVEFEAEDHAKAAEIARSKVDDVRWGDHFVVVEGDSGRFLEIWEKQPNA